MDWEEAVASSNGLADLAKLSILLVEDEAPIRETLREFFLSKDFVVSVASNGDQARELLRSEPTFDLVITDLKLPVGSGVDVLRQARAKNPSGYVVFMTGFASLESAIEAVRLGAFEYLVKPFSLGELDLTLERIAEHRRLADTNRRLSGELEQLRPFRDLDRRHDELKASVETLTAEMRRQSELLERLVSEPSGAPVPERSGPSGPRPISSPAKTTGKLTAPSRL